MKFFNTLQKHLSREKTPVLDVALQEKKEKVSSLSPRERETYLLLLQGFTLQYCAEQMGIKYPTVNTYVNAIYKKLDVNSRAQLIIQYRDIL